jgi:L-malate glycosyltransferase
VRRLAGHAGQALLLHVSPSFAIAGVLVRTSRIVNHFDRQFRQAIIALDRNFEAPRQVLSNIDLDLPVPAQRHSAVHDIASAVMTLRRVKPDLLVTYNRDSIDWVTANRPSPVAPPLHCEDGFGKEEANRQSRRGILCRRWSLARCKSVAVPSRLLKKIAHDICLPAQTITYIPNEVNVERFSVLRQFEL